jgi:hypothetical protein
MGRKEQTMAKKTIVLLLVLPLAMIAAAFAQKTPAAKEQGHNLPPLTYSQDIAPIIQNNCTSCHHPGDVAPFSLLTYADVKKRVDTIEAVVEAGVMPPWKPTPGYGEFAGDRRLSAVDREKLLRWIKADAPAGDLTKAPAPPVYTVGWHLGPPDLIVKMPAPYNVRATGPDEYRCFVIPLNLTEDKFVRASEFHPSNKRVLHHSLFFLDTMGVAKSKEKESSDGQPGYKSFGGIGFTPTGGLGGWAPGNRQHELPPGVARRLRKGSDLVLQSHFHPTGKPEVEQSELGIYFAKQKPERILLPFIVNATKQIDIPAGDASYKVSSSSVLPADFDLRFATPHAHLLCKDIKSWAVTPDKQTIPLIWIKDWDFNWQEGYQFAKPLRLPKGTVVTAEFVYDNSSKNPKNPSNPPKRVTRGEQTTDEMGIIFFNGTLVDQKDMLGFLGSMFQNHVGESLRSKEK